MKRPALVLAAATGTVLLAMVAVSVITGATQEVHEHYHPPAEYATNLLAHPGGLRLLMGLDVAFLVLYTAFFGALAKYLKSTLAWIGFAAMAAVAVLDIIEDHHILSLLALAEHGKSIDDASIAFQEILSSTKFSISYLALFLFGISVPRTSKLAWALCLFLTVGNLMTGVLGFAAPIAWREGLDSGRWIGFLAGFALAFLWLRSTVDET